MSILKEIARKDRELEATIKRPAEAEKYKVEKLAEANRYAVNERCCSLPVPQFFTFVYKLVL